MSAERVRPELDKRPPLLGKEDAVSLITGYFPFKSVSPMSLKQLPSYDDRMFYFEGENEELSLDHSVRKPFVLKISNKIFGRDVITGQNAVMLHLAAGGINCCQPILCRRGHYLEMLKTEVLLSKTDGRCGEGNEAEYAVRVLQYIPGEPMSRVEKRYLTPQLMYCVGNHVAKIDIALQSVDHMHPGVTSRVLECWDLQYFMCLKKYILHVEDKKTREMAHTVMAAYETNVLPRLPSMKKGIIHGDANGLNIILQKIGEEYEIAGVIDFGDTVCSHYLFELAIMLAHKMMVVIEYCDPVEFVAPMLHGFLDALPLSGDDLSCLYYAVIARLATIAVKAEYDASMDASNTHISHALPVATKTMEMLLAVDKEDVDRKWKLKSKFLF